jgi:hypothetical protein
MSPPIWEPAIEKTFKYGIEKWLGGFDFGNILKLVIYIPLRGKIFSACLWVEKRK